MHNFIDVSEHIIAINKLAHDEKQYDKADELINKIVTTEYWKNYSEEVKKFIEENDKVFFCEWNGDIGQIHTEQSMYENYKDTNLYDREEWYGKQYNFSSYEDFETLVKYAGVEEVNTEDNMMIVRLK
jgi:hypothetical protein